MPSVSWRSDLARSRRLMASTSIPNDSARLLGDPDLARLREFRGELVADVVGVGQLGDLPDVHDRLGELYPSSIGEPQPVGVQDRGRSTAARPPCAPPVVRRGRAFLVGGSCRSSIGAAGACTAAAASVALVWSSVWPVSAASAAAGPPLCAGGARVAVAVVGGNAQRRGQRIGDLGRWFRPGSPPALSCRTRRRAG